MKLFKIFLTIITFSILSLFAQETILVKNFLPIKDIFITRVTGNKEGTDTPFLNKEIWTKLSDFVFNIQCSKYADGEYEGNETYKIYYQLETDRIIKESASGSKEIILQGPIKLNNSWKNNDGTYQIDKINFTFGKYSNCISIKYTSFDRSQEAQEIFSPSIGQVYRSSLMKKYNILAVTKIISINQGQ